MMVYAMVASSTYCGGEDIKDSFAKQKEMAAQHIIIFIIISLASLPFVRRFYRVWE
jgi:hypothetical protein